ncbi:MAG: epimerase, partial [Bacteroidota bacterium]|nr:epimerase [Bacteroidota bacterium]
AIITGATGMVGEGVLHECLLNEDVESVLVINRRPCKVFHSKLKEIILDNFQDYSNIEDKLVGYNAAFLCMGVSSVGMPGDEYFHITYELTLALARTLSKLNPGLTLCYISGLGTDSSERGRINWARVKGRTENELIQLFPNKAFMFRPAYIQPTKGLQHTYKTYKVLGVLYPVWKFLFPKYVSKLSEIGLAMINVSKSGFNKTVLESKDIIELAHQTRR